MITARTIRRNLMDRLFLGGMAWTNDRPWFGFAGVVATIGLYCVLRYLLETLA